MCIEGQHVLSQMHEALDAVTVELAEMTRERDRLTRKNIAANDKIAELERKVSFWIGRYHQECEQHTIKDRECERWLFQAAELERERDAFVELAAAFLGDVTPLSISTAIEEFKQRSMRPYNVQWYERYRRIVQALEDLPKVTS